MASLRSSLGAISPKGGRNRSSYHMEVSSALRKKRTRQDASRYQRFMHLARSQVVSLVRSLQHRRLHGNSSGIQFCMERCIETAGILERTPVSYLAVVKGIFRGFGGHFAGIYDFL